MAVRRARPDEASAVLSVLDEIAAGLVARGVRQWPRAFEPAWLEPSLAELVDLKFFCGFSFIEIAGIRNVSERTVQRDWAKARLLLHSALRDGGERS